MAAGEGAGRAATVVDSDRAAAKIRLESPADPPVPPAGPAPAADGPAPRPARVPLLALTGVSRSYGERLALQPGRRLRWRPGSASPCMGANGSGKSTLLRIAAGRDTPTTGHVVYAGRGLTQDDSRCAPRSPWSATW